MAKAGKDSGAKSGPMYQLRIELQRVKPLIWRRLLVPASIRLARLHTTIQVAMGWEGGHLHEFVIAEEHYGPVDPHYPYDPPLRSENRISLKSALAGARTFRYVYDFGDDWEHKIKVEKLWPDNPGFKLPMLLDGANACPPEDVGGAYGYLEFLEAIRNPDHEEHATMLDWIGGSFDPAAFDSDQVNARLSTIST
jgi:hypothetical protein